MKVADLTVDEFKALVRDAVREALDEEWDDDGELRPEFIAEIEASLMESDDRGISLGDMRLPRPSVKWLP